MSFLVPRPSRLGRAAVAVGAPLVLLALISVWFRAPDYHISLRKFCFSDQGCQHLTGDAADARLPGQLALYSGLLAVVAAVGLFLGSWFGSRRRSATSALAILGATLAGLALLCGLWYAAALEDHMGELHLTFAPPLFMAAALVLLLGFIDHWPSRELVVGATGDPAVEPPAPDPADIKL